MWRRCMQPCQPKDLAVSVTKSKKRGKADKTTVKTKSGAQGSGQSCEMSILLRSEADSFPEHDGAEGLVMQLFRCLEETLKSGA